MNEIYISVCSYISHGYTLLHLLLVLWVKIQYKWNLFLFFFIPLLYDLSINASSFFGCLYLTILFQPISHLCFWTLFPISSYVFPHNDLSVVSHHQITCSAFMLLPDCLRSMTKISHQHSSKSYHEIACSSF